MRCFACGKENLHKRGCMFEPNQRDKEVTSDIARSQPYCRLEDQISCYRSELDAEHQDALERVRWEAYACGQRSATLALVRELDAWRLANVTYFSKALWRELDSQIVALGGETRDYWAHCTVKRP